MEHAVLLSGIGGQGVQFAGSLLAHAAVAEGRQVQLFGSYGGMMRGGSTEATLILADMPVTGPPTVSRAESAIVLHHAFWPQVADRLGPGSILVANSSVLAPEQTVGPWRTVAVPATTMAAEAGNASGVAIAVVGAWAKVTGLISADALETTLPDLMPARRRHHLESSLRLLRQGADYEH